MEVARGYREYYDCWAQRLVWLTYIWLWLHGPHLSAAVGVCTFRDDLKGILLNPWCHYKYESLLPRKPPWHVPSGTYWYIHLWKTMRIWGGCYMWASCSPAVKAVVLTHSCTHTQWLHLLISGSGKLESCPLLYVSDVAATAGHPHDGVQWRLSDTV